MLRDRLIEARAVLTVSQARRKISSYSTDRYSRSTRTLMHPAPLPSRARAMVIVTMPGEPL